MGEEREILGWLDQTMAWKVPEGPEAFCQYLGTDTAVCGASCGVAGASQAVTSVRTSSLAWAVVCAVQ